MNHRIQATILRLGIEVGVVSKADIILWADSILESNEPYEDWMGSLATCRDLPFHQVFSFLGEVSGEVITFDELWPPLRTFLLLKIEESRLSPREAIELLCDHLWDGLLPKDIEGEAITLKMEYDCVTEGYCKEEDINQDTLAFFRGRTNRESQ